MADEDDDGFFARWSRRKAGVQRGPAPPAEKPAAEPAAVMPDRPPAAAPGADGVEAATAQPRPPPPTLDDVAALPADAPDFSRFVARDVDPSVRHAALKKLFSDPHFNTMDGLDVYIDDYGRPDPLPAGWLQRMVQSELLGHLAAPASAASTPAAKVSPPAVAPAPALTPPTDEDADLRLQPHDAARPEGDRGGAGEDAGREH